MPIKKPSFPQNVDPSRLARSLDAIQSKVEALKGADGKVDVDTLKQAVGSDPVVSEDLKHILEQFDGFVPVGQGRPSDSLNPRPVNSSCSGLTGYATSPSELDQAQVSSVMSLLMKVKSEVKAADKDGDGVVSESEVKSARQRLNRSDLPLLEERLLRNAFHGADPQVEKFFNDEFQYEGAKQNLAETISRRSRVSSLLNENAKHHADTPEGADALVWAYRALMVNAPSYRVGELPKRMDNDAQAAEQSLLRFVPFSGVKNASGHLSDAEVQQLLGTDDLRAFTAGKKAEVLAQAGGDWDGWLQGADLEKPE